MPEELYRGLLLVLMLGAGATIRYWRWRAERGGAVSRSEEGAAMFWSLRLAGAAAGIATLGYVIHPPWLAWSQLPLTDPVRLAGAPLGLAAWGFFAWTLAHLGENLTDTVATRPRHALVTTGPYAWVRHPFYLATALLFASAALLSANLAIAGAGVAVLGLLAARTPREEAQLAARFGDAYRAYCARTGRFLPRLGRGD